jgi:hypothetical protein
MFDEWVRKQWLDKSTVYPYTKSENRFEALRLRSQLVPAYLVRYADDFVIITDSREHAQWWKKQIQNFLWDNMRLVLSENKTLITDVRKKYVHFLGFEYKLVKGKAKFGYITRTLPDRARLKSKTDSIVQDIKTIPPDASREQMVNHIHRINSKIRGLINYYSCCSWVNIAMQKHARKLQLAANKRLMQYKGKWIPAKETRNLMTIHEGYDTKIPAIKCGDIWVGITSLTFCKWKSAPWKKPAETPYSKEGRDIYFERTKKKQRDARLDEILSTRTSELIANGLTGKLYNFEFFMNRAYALNRDKLKCRVCGKWLYNGLLFTHRINPHLPLSKVNKVGNLASMHKQCFELVNNPKADMTYLPTKTRGNVEKFRNQLVKSHDNKTV